MNDLQTLLSTLRDDGVQLWVHDGHLRYRCRSGSLDTFRLAEIRRHKEDIIAFLAEPLVSRTSPLTGEPRPSVLPLSYAQEGLWFLDQMGMLGPAYNVPTIVRMEGDLDLGLLDRAMCEVVRRHEILRTRFQTVDGVGAQVIEPAVEGGIKVIDLSLLETVRRQEATRQLSQLLAEYEFNLERECAFKVHVLRLAETEHLLIVNMHHIIADARSIEILLRELSALYVAYGQGQTSPLPEMGAQYADYALWQRRWLQGEVLGKQLAYWKSRLAGAPESLNLPVDRARPAMASFRGGWVEFKLPPAICESLDALTRSYDMTPFMALLGAFQALLSRWSGQKDVIVGSPIEGRGHQQAEDMIGYFLNALVLRADLSGDVTFNDLLKQVKASVLDAYEYRDLPFDRLVAELRPERDPSRQPLFQVLFTYQGLAQENSVMPGLKLSPVLTEARTAKFDLSLFISETGDGLEGSFEYATDLFDHATIERLVGHFKTLLEAAVENPQARIAELPLLTDAEREQLLVEWNDNRLEFPGDKCIHELFEAQAARTPDAIAVVFEGRQLSYGELNARSNQLAHHLRTLGVGAETLVGICVERSLEMVVGLLGILKSGGAYVPLDPAYPQARLAYMLADTQAAVLLTQARLKDELPEHGAQVLCLDADWPTVAQQPLTNPVNYTQPLNLAYCIYTSGSTGKPKGVALQHWNAVGFLTWASQAFERDHTARVLFSTSICFDISIFELFSPLVTGGSVLLVRDALALSEGTIEPPPVLINTVPSAAQALLDAQAFPHTVKVINLAGEPLQRALVERLHAAVPQARVYNLYGPTEDTTYSTYCEVVPDAGSKVTVGRPVSNTQVYILDGGLEPVPIGVPGEIYIAGAGLARGYLNRPDLTAEKFIPNPFGEPGSRMYKTGDLGRYLPDSSIDCLGRIDHQVKIRGFRIELGEIESALLRCEGIFEAVVIAREDTPGDRRLVAYLVARDQDGPAASELRAHLQTSLPEYMIPAAFVFLDALPLNPNGKIDRKLLPAPGASHADLGVGYVAPRTSTEKLLASIWAEVLKVERVGIHDNFFALGGHSLLATQVAARIKQTLQAGILMRDFFVAPTLAELAKHISSAQAAGREHIRRAARPGRPAASFAQQRLWFLDQFEPGTGLYNMPAAWRIHGALNLLALEQSLNEIVRRHEALRTTFAAENGFPVQVIAERLRLTLPITDLSSLVDADAQAQLIVQEEDERPFDLAQGPLIRAGLIKLAEHEHILMLTLHHIIGDGWSLAVILGELDALYSAYSTGQASPLAELPIQYADYAVWQREWLQGEVLEEQLSFWKRYLDGAPPASELPTDHMRPPTLTHRGTEIGFTLSQELNASLRKLSQRSHVTMFMTLAAAFNVLLQRYSRQDDICIGYPVGNRSRVEIEGLLGMFVNMLVLRTRLSPQDTFETLLKQVRESVLDAEAHQDLPFEKLVEELRPERDPSRQPLFQICYSYSTTHEQSARSTASLPGLAAAALSLASLEITPVLSKQRSVKFDMNLFISDTQEGIEGIIDYATDLFDQETIERLIGHFKTLLESVAAHPEQRLSQLPLLTDAERRQLLVEWNDTKVEFPGDKCIHELFEAQAERSPLALAVKYGDESLTYRELNSRANQVAHYLRRLGVGPEALVGICVERSLEMVVGLLGIIKAGGAYLPLDPSYPKERLAFMLQDAQAAVLLTQERLIESIPEPVARVVCLDRDWEEIAGEATENPLPTAQASNLAYMIYTSGSTGKPKGTMVSHFNVVRLFQATQTWFNFDERDVWTLFHSYAFDFSVWELWGALLYGGRLVIVPYLVSRSPEAFYQLLAEEQVTVLNQTPSAFRQLIRAEESLDGAHDLNLRFIIFGGEALELQSLKPWFDRHGDDRPRLVNMYGITETTVHVTYRPLTADDVGATLSSLIGGPIPDLQVYVMDQHMQLVPIGVAGEMYVGGAGVARGYSHRPDLTAQRFVPDPFDPRPGGRLYRTGDRARRLANGDIEYLGRLDYQVKIRGFRIELGEIESALLGCEGVREAVVVAREDTPGDQRLAAYLVTSDQDRPTVSELRAQLQTSLPEYMVPAAYVFLDVLLLNANGKTDLKALPAPGATNTDAGVEYVAPRTLTEGLLAVIWAEVLKVDRVGIHDNFFTLGGHSLLAVHLMAQIQRQFERNLPLSTLFAGATVERMASILQQQPASPSSSPLVEIQPGGSQPPFFFVHPVGGNVFCYYQLANFLKPDQPFYGLQARGLENGQEPFRRVEEMAASYVEAVRARQPRGPYFLGGWSLGGVLAFEMARQLRSQRESIALLALIDSWAPSPGAMPEYDDAEILTEFFLDLCRIHNRNISVSPETLIAELRPLGSRHQLEHLLDRARRLDVLPSDADLPQIGRLLETFKANLQAVQHYAPQSFDGCLILFRADDEDQALVDSSLGWRELARQVEVQSVSGDHYSILNPPHVRTLAEGVKNYLDETQPVLVLAQS
jgi:amino acid adenylation domain-containing protein